MGTKNNPGQFDGYAKAKDDEPMFVLLGRDQSAALLVRVWAILRARRVQLGMRPPEDAAKIAEARHCSIAMREYCQSIGRIPLPDSEDLAHFIATAIEGEMDWRGANPPGVSPVPNTSPPRNGQ